MGAPSASNSPSALSAQALRDRALCARAGKLSFLQKIDTPVLVFLSFGLFVCLSFRLVLGFLISTKFIGSRPSSSRVILCLSGRCRAVGGDWIGWLEGPHQSSLVV